MVDNDDNMDSNYPKLNSSDEDVSTPEPCDFRELLRRYKKQKHLRKLIEVEVPEELACTDYDDNISVEEYVVESVINFTMDLYKEISREKHGNLIMSTLGVHAVLTMTASGAQGSTAEEMQKCLHMVPSSASVENLSDKTLQDYGQFLGAFDNKIPGVKLTMSNKIYTARDFSIKDKFKEITASYFKSESESIDFTKVEEAVDIVNQWCSSSTNQKINKLLQKDDLRPGICMLLLNAIYFQGDWRKKFQPDRTSQKMFHLNDNETIEVPTMQKQDNFTYGFVEDLDAMCIILPYENEHFKMVLVVPREVEGLEHVEKNLSEAYPQVMEVIEKETDLVILHLPKFKIASSIDLNEHLQKVGFREMFTNRANFHGISDKITKVDKVLQKALIEVNERGTMAAAATCVSIKVCRAFVHLKVDKPFLFMIVYKKTPLFIGRVVNPLD